MLCVVRQLDECLKFMAVQGVVLHGIQSFLSPRICLYFRHLSSCDTIVLFLSELDIYTKPKPEIK